MNDWVLADLTDISRQIFQIGEEYRLMTLGKGNKPRHMNKHPQQLLKYFYFLYLTGSRLMEPAGVEREKPSITIFNNPDGVWVQISKVNAKHKAPNGVDRQMITQVFPIFDEWEQAMWNRITDGGTQTNIDEIFQLKDWPSTKQDIISDLIKHNFKANLRDPNGKLHRDTGLIPHILRHMRTFNVVIERGVPDAQVVRWFGWTNSRMIYYYANMRQILEAKSQLELLKRTNHLTKLSVDLGKAMSGY